MAPALVLVLAPAWKTLEVGDATVYYPPAFSVRRGDDHDAAFVAPGQRVEFYFAPYATTSAFRSLNPQPGERRIAERIVRKGGSTTIWRTFRKTSGERAIEATSWDGGKGWRVFGQRYRSAADLRRHRTEYLRFKRSVEEPGC